MRELVDAFYGERSIVNHHIASYNDFLATRLQHVIDHIRIGDDDTAERGIVQTDIEGYYIKLGKISVGRPVVKEADGSLRPLTPMEARLRNLTYQAPLTLEFIPVIDGIEHEPELVNVGRLPIMAHSDHCNINRKVCEEHEGRALSEEEYRAKLTELQEDALDPGGYFISNGTERVLITLEDLAPNRVLVEKATRYGTDVEIAKVFSQHEGYRALVVVERKKDGDLMVTVPSASGQIPLAILLRALGMESDEEIVHAIMSDDSMEPLILGNIESSAEEYGVTSREDAIAYLGKRLAGGQAKEYRVKRVEALMDRNLLPHLGQEPEDRITKAIFLARMGQSVFELHLGLRETDDKDHYANKRLKLAGDLMEDLFRVAFMALCKDLKYQLERAHARNRDVKIQTAVRADVLTQRLLHSLATGNWVSGRAGVSQLLDRTSNLAALSHMRRVTSPLTRSQPHFEARDLHSTQWGRLCPNETPEGPNCGLVKNLSLCVEISEGFPEREVERVLRDFSLRPVERDAPGAQVFLNGDLVGLHEEAGELVQRIKERRRAGLLSNEVNVFHDKDSNAVFLNCDAGRVRRPLLVVDNGNLRYNDEHRKDLLEGRIAWSDLVNEGVIEYIDAEEEENLYISVQDAEVSHAVRKGADEIEEINVRLHDDHTHCEIDPMIILGIGSSLVPYPEHNSSPRITMGAGMGKQSLGFGDSNYRIRPDTRGHLMHYPQAPLTQNHAGQYLNFNARPAGQNFVVAVMSFHGYNMEDAIVMNKASIERGLGRSSFFRTYATEERRYPGGQEDRFERPDPECRACTLMKGNATSLPPTAGFGLRHPHVLDVISRPPAIDWVEVHTENYMVPGGPRLRQLDAIRERFDLSFHGVGLSLGSVDEPDREHLTRIRDLVRRYRPAALSDHIAWVRAPAQVGGASLNDLLPLPYTDATLNRGGIRLGTSDFYDVVESLSWVEDSLVVDTSELGKEGALVLFVRLAEGAELNDDTRQELNRLLISSLSPRHRPDRVFALDVIPRTLTGKKLEVPVKRIINGAAAADVVNLSAVDHPLMLQRIEQLARF